MPATVRSPPDDARPALAAAALAPLAPPRRPPEPLPQRPDKARPMSRLMSDLSPGTYVVNPDTSLSVSSQRRAFLPHGLPVGRPPALAFSASPSPRLPHGRRLPSPVEPPRGRDQCAGVKTGASCPHSIATTTGYSAIAGRLHMRTVACQGAARVFLGGSLPRSCPSSSVGVTCWLVTRNEPVSKTGAQQDTPELPVEVRRDGFLRLSEQIGAQLGAQVRTEREMLEHSAPPAPSR
jgi:hypothetical protein